MGKAVGSAFDRSVILVDDDMHIRVAATQALELAGFEVRAFEGAAQALEVLDELVDYTLSHFAFEESLMEESGYAYINAHKKVHQLFVKRVADYQQRFKMNEDIAEELINTLRAWLINHIRNDDKDYSGDVLKNMQTVSTRRDGWLKRSLSRFFG